MKTKITLLLVSVISIGILSCSTDYKKTKTGIIYKIFPGDSQDSTAKLNDVVKFSVIQKFNDSLLYTSHGKVPAYIQLNFPVGADYNPWDVLYDLRKGDSAVIVELFDTLIKKGLAQQLPFVGKSGDRITSYIKVIEIFKVDSLGRADYLAEMEKDKPRQEKEAAEMEAKQAEEIKKQRDAEIAELKKSGEYEKQDKQVRDYMAAKNVNGTKTPDGDYVYVKQKGTGEPAATGKFVTVKYSGRMIETDSVFESSQYIFKLGQGSVIHGWDDGITYFNKGGSGTLFIPGYLAYGKRPGPGGKTYEALVFDIEILNVSDTQEKAYADKRVADSLANASTVKKK